MSEEIINKIKTIYDTLYKFDFIDINSFDMKTSNSAASFFVIASAISERQIEHCTKDLKFINIFDFRPKISKTKEWIVADFRSIIMINLVSKGVREYYNFDKLWQEIGGQLLQINIQN